jgi:hypothetical protein
MSRQRIERNERIRSGCMVLIALLALIAVLMRRMLPHIGHR